MKPNDIVKYSNPEPGEEGFRFVLVEHNGDRVVIQDVEPLACGLEPQELVAPEDICLALEIVCTPELNEETGRTVVEWAVMNGSERLAAGYCATEAEARSDAQIWIDSR